MENKSTKISGLTSGIIIFVYLAILTAVEFWVGVNNLPTVLLWVIALVKVALVLWFFMHLGRVVQPEAEEHE
jgi:heme/copper-type cytochrome/quinol oxidase subunit 4